MARPVWVVKPGMTSGAVNQSSVIFDAVFEYFQLAREVLIHLGDVLLEFLEIVLDICCNFIESFGAFIELLDTCIDFIFEFLDS